MSSHLFYYTVGYSSFEEHPYIVLAHTEHFTEDVFRDLCVRIALECYRNEPHRDSFDDLYIGVADQLVHEHGFKRVRAAASFMPWGWGSFVEREPSWQHMYDDDYDALHRAARNQRDEMTVKRLP